MNPHGIGAKEFCHVWTKYVSWILIYRYTLSSLLYFLKDSVVNERFIPTNAERRTAKKRRFSL